MTNTNPLDVLEPFFIVKVGVKEQTCDIVNCTDQIDMDNYPKKHT